MKLTTEQRDLLLRVAERPLELRDNRLVWVDESDPVPVTEQEKELLRGLWRGGYIWIPRDGDGPVRLTDMGTLLDRELKIFGERPSSPASNETRVGQRR